MQSRTEKSQKRSRAEAGGCIAGYNAWLRRAESHELKAAAFARRYLGLKKTRICDSAYAQRQELRLPELRP